MSTLTYLFVRPRKIVVIHKIKEWRHSSLAGKGWVKGEALLSRTLIGEYAEKMSKQTQLTAWEYDIQELEELIRDERLTGCDEDFLTLLRTKIEPLQPPKRK